MQAMVWKSDQNSSALLSNPDTDPHWSEYVGG